MLITKREDATKIRKVSVKYSDENGSVWGESLISTYSTFCVCQRGKGGRVGVGVGAYLGLSGKGKAVGWGWGWVLINFFFL